MLETFIIGFLFGNEKTRNAIVQTAKNIANTTIDTLNNKKGDVDVSEINAKTIEIKEKL